MRHDMHSGDRSNSSLLVRMLDAMQGRYIYKLLAVDVPAAEGAEQRLFLEGDNSIYSRGGVMSELRDPFLRVRNK